MLGWLRGRRQSREAALPSSSAKLCITLSLLLLGKESEIASVVSALERLGFEPTNPSSAVLRQYGLVFGKAERQAVPSLSQVSGVEMVEEMIVEREARSTWKTKKKPIT